MRLISRCAAALLVLAAACTPPPPVRTAPPPPPAPPAQPPFTAAEVWTAEPGVVLRGSAGPLVLPFTFMHLTVLRVDSTELEVRCTVCRGLPTGRVDRTKVVHAAATPREAARGDLAGFALAIRAAALRRDIPALREVMSRDFVSSLSGGDGVLEAVGAWQGPRENDLRRLVGLLDRGIVNVRGTPVWAAPPEYANTPNYPDLRTGFRLGPNGWEWLFLVRSEL